MRQPIPLIEQTYELVPTDQLVEHPDNARRGDVDLISKSIDSNGFYGSVIVQRSTRHVLAGNHRLRAARERGIETMPVIWVEVDDDRAKRIMAVDNKSNDAAEYDEQALIDLLSGFAGDLNGTGFTQGDLEKMLAAQAPPESMPLDPEALSIIVECASEEQQSHLLERFADEGLRCRALMM